MSTYLDFVIDSDIFVVDRSYTHKLKKKLLGQARLKLIELWKAKLIARGEQTWQEEEQLVFSEEELLQALDNIDTPTSLNDYQWAKLKAYFKSTESKRNEIEKEVMLDSWDLISHDVHEVMELESQKVK
ncbi:hypothetical protein ACFE04_028287 [Oxalis oulophora]